MPAVWPKGSTAVAAPAARNPISNYSETTKTEFLPPNGFWTLSLALGSGTHWPSTTKRYS